MVSYARIRQLQSCPWQTHLHVHYCGSQTEGPSIGDPSRVQFPDNGEPRTYIIQQFACTSLVPVASSWCQATTIVEIPPQKFQNTSIDLHRMQQKNSFQSTLITYLLVKKLIKHKCSKFSQTWHFWALLTYEPLRARIDTPPQYKQWACLIIALPF
jgi:hypothetical protein